MSSTNLGPAVTATPQPQASIGNIQKNALISASITPASVNAAITAGQSFTIAALGVVVGDQIAVCGVPSIAPAGVFPAGATVTAADTVQILFANVTAGALVPPAGVYTFEINRAQANVAFPTEYLNSF